MTLCHKHRDDYMRALDIKPMILPAFQQIGSPNNEAHLLRQSLESMQRRYEDWRTTVQHLRTMARENCAAGRWCDNGQPALIEAAA